MRASCALLENFSCASLRNEKEFPRTPSQKNFEADALKKTVPENHTETADLYIRINSFGSRHDLDTRRSRTTILNS
jgi:hypothetical protein